MFPIVIFVRMEGANGRNVPGIAFVDPDVTPIWKSLKSRLADDRRTTKRPDAGR